MFIGTPCTSDIIVYISIERGLDPVFESKIKMGGGEFAPSFGKPSYLVKREPAPVLAEFCKFILNWTSTRSNTSSRSRNIFIQTNKKMFQ